HHRDLHSFPTRRSSDLIIQDYKNYFPGISRYPKVYKADGLGLDTRVVVGIDGQEMFLGLAEKYNVLVKGTFNLSQYIDSTYSFRSEEHTSELQSRENLV